MFIVRAVISFYLKKLNLIFMNHGKISCYPIAVEKKIIPWFNTIIIYFRIISLLLSVKIRLN